MSKFVNFHTKNLVYNIPSYIEDTPDLLRKFEDFNQKHTFPENCFPVSLDVVGLYSNIRKEDGIAAFQEALQDRKNTDIPNDFLLKMLTLILTLNLFEYDNALYEQAVGTAMGTSCAPTYATVFMKRIDEWIRNSAPPDAILLFFRFLDDILFWWTKGVEELEKFIQTINSLHPTIKFTANYCPETRSCDYLDLNVRNVNGKISTDLFRKNSDRVKYLLPTSCHPKHVCESIPYSLGLRIRRICSNEDDFKKRLEELKNMLLSRQYKTKVIDEALEKVKRIPRQEALKKKERNDNGRPTFVLTYKPQLPSVAQIMHKHWKALTFQDEEMMDLFPKPPMVAYKQKGNLKSQLCKAKVPAPIQSKGNSLTQRTCNSRGLIRCQQVSCNTCPYLNTSTTVTSSNSATVVPLTAKLTCTTTNVIYCISCKQCCAQYVGQTGRRLKDRFAEHIRYVKNGTDTPTGTHFNLPGHSLKDMTIQVIEQLQSPSRTTRELRESMWIKRFRATMNEKA